MRGARVEAVRATLDSHLRLVFIMFCDSITLRFLKNFNHPQVRFEECKNRSPLLLCGWELRLTPSSLLPHAPGDQQGYDFCITDEATVRLGEGRL